MDKLNSYPNTRRIVEGLLTYWNAHEKFVRNRFDVANDDLLGITEHVSENILAISGGDMQPYYEGYKWMCEAVFQEEFHFRSHGKYRLSRFEDANREVYSKPEIMGPYMKGLLLSQTLWSNHTKVLQIFKEHFLTLPACAAQAYLEVGPGHGLYLSTAIEHLQCYKIYAWDISQQSIEETRECLAKLKIDAARASLVTQDLFKAENSGQFDKIVFSEILEHMEDPAQALEKLHGLLSHDGTLFLNVPVNSPAPDHVANWETPEDLIACVEKAGFTCAQKFLLPSTGYTLESARKRKTAISCVLFLKKN